MEEEVFGYRSSSKLNRGMLNDKNLRIEVLIFVNRRITDCELELWRFPLMNSTPASELHTLSSKGSVYWDIEDIRTPSSPHIMEIGQEDNNSLGIQKETKQIEDIICRVESNRGNMGTIVSDRDGFGESVKDNKTVEGAKISEVCSDELDCHSISLHKFLLQPRGVRSTVENKYMKAEQKISLKSKNDVRKLRVEVKRLRLIP